MAQPSTLPPIVRLITTHDSSGKAIFSSALQDRVEQKAVGDGEAVFALPYCSDAFPVDMNHDADLTSYQKYMGEAPGLVINSGTVLRHVDMAPGHFSPMHRTVSLDYGIVMEGEIELVLDSGERRKMKRGDIAVQRGTMHAWSNPSSTEWTRMLFVLQPAKPLDVAGQKLGEDLETMKGVRSSS